MMLTVNVLIVLNNCDDDATQYSDQYTQIHDIHRRLYDIAMIIHLLIAWLKTRFNDMKGSADDEI